MKPRDRERLIAATTRAVAADAKAKELLDKRDQLAAGYADQGAATYAELAECMGITPDGVTYVLRKVRRAANA